MKARGISDWLFQAVFSVSGILLLMTIHWAFLMAPIEARIRESAAGTVIKPTRSAAEDA